MSGPLSHLSVLDLSRILAGPWCSQLLADLGATVIKIEHPARGDDTRSWGPPFLKDRAGTETHEAAYYLGANRNKQSVAVDFTQEEGREIVRGLARTADVMLENYKVGGLAKYGLDYPSISAENPGIVYCSITGFGQSGPYAKSAGYDFMIQGMGGLMSITGERDDRPGGGPQKVGVAVADIMTGLYATIGIQAALAHRDRTGVGQHVDMALLDTQVAMIANLNMNYLVSGKIPGRMGNAHANIVPYEAFACSDGHIILAVGNDAQFQKFCQIAGRPDIAEDARYRRNADRVRNRESLVPLVASLIKTRTMREWIQACDAAHVPCGPINRLDQVFADPQVRHRGMRIDLPHPLSGTVPQVVNPIKLSATPLDFHAAPPLLGQHTAAVLHERLGYDSARIEELAARGVIKVAPAEA
jgi:crotonobetainyl-CoA:carnitine CoA-transferase CaiB-like acyl-CoA transferase